MPPEQRLEHCPVDYFAFGESQNLQATPSPPARRLASFASGPLSSSQEARLRRHRRRRSPATEPLLQTMAQYGEMAGWLLQDAGALDAAASWSRRAAEWAACAGDNRMAAYMLIRQANIATLTDDRAAVVQLAAAARRAPGSAESRLTALALQQQARGHARLAEFRECFALLDQAAESLRDNHLPCLYIRPAESVLPRLAWHQAGRRAAF
jgi:hypothetical protein